MGAEQVDWQFQSPGPGLVKPRFAALFQTTIDPSPQSTEWIRDLERPRWTARRTTEYTAWVCSPFPTGAEFVDWQFQSPGPGRVKPCFADLYQTSFTIDPNPRPPLTDWMGCQERPRWTARRTTEYTAWVCSPFPIPASVGDWGTPAVVPVRRPRPNPILYAFETFGLPNLPTTIDGWGGSFEFPPRKVGPRPAGGLFVSIMPPDPFDWLIGQPDIIRRKMPPRLDTTVYPGEWPTAVDPFGWYVPFTPMPVVRSSRQNVCEFRPSDDPVPLGALWTIASPLRVAPRRPSSFDLAPMGMVDLNTDWIVAVSLPPGRRRAATQPEIQPPPASFVVSTDWVPPTADRLPVTRPTRRPTTETTSPPAQYPYDLAFGFELVGSIYRPRPRTRFPAEPELWLWNGNPPPVVIIGNARAWWTAEPGGRWWDAGAQGMSALVRNTVQKEAGDSVRLGIDWGEIPELIAGATLVTVTINTTPSGLVVSGQQNDTSYRTSAVFTGGASGINYFVVFSATLSTNAVVTRTCPLQVV